MLLLRGDVTTPDTLRVVDAVASKVTTSDYNRMSLAVTRASQDPTEVATQFLTANGLP